MSCVSNQVILTWKDVENFITRRAPTLFADTTALDFQSREVVKEAYMLWYLATWDTLYLSGTPLSKSDSYRWLFAICSEPVRDMVDLLKEVSHLLVSGDFSSYDAFKQHLCKSFSFVGAILAPMKKEIDLWFRESDTEALNRVYSWSLFIGHLNLPGLVVLREGALSKYLRIEEGILDDGFTAEEAVLLRTWFPRTLEDMQVLTDEHSPEHGPGSTADAGTSMQKKYESLCTDPKLAMLNRRVYGSARPYPREETKSLLRRSKTIFVAKSLGAYRTISEEPASLMWHQKGVRAALFKLLQLRRHYLLRRFIPEDQQPNRDLAWLGSIDGSFATIDLSSASDSVSWSLVKKWFRNTSLYPWLLWTRSTCTLLPNGEEIKLRKYAPSGSDLCFPIETYIFCAIAECAIKECGGDPKLSEFRVYGDDIVIEDEYVPAVLRRLVQNGFTPNLEKTFSGTQPKGFFRESCGGFFMNGADISPTRLSRRFVGYSRLGENTPGRIEAVIELANDCSSRYPSVRRWLILRLLSLPKHLRPPFSSDGSRGLFSIQPTNYHLDVKESVDLQCPRYAFGIAKVPARQRRLSWEDIRYYEYLRRVEHRKRLTWPEDLVIVDVSPIPPSSWKSKRAPLY